MDRYGGWFRLSLAANPDIAQIAASLINGSLADHADLDSLRKVNPELVSFRAWPAGSGRMALEAALRAHV